MHSVWNRLEFALSGVEKEINRKIGQVQGSMGVTDNPVGKMRGEEDGEKDGENK
jgi:hypothetical protein